MVAATNNKKYNPKMLITTTHPSSHQRLSYLLINPFIVNPTASSKLTPIPFYYYRSTRTIISAGRSQRQRGKSVRSMAAQKEKDNVEEAIRADEAVGNEKRKEDFGLQLQ